MRMLYASGQRAGLAVFAQPNDVLPQSSLERPDNATVVGVIVTRGTIPRDRLSDLVADPLVFIPDVTQTFIRQEMEGTVPNPEEISMSLQSPFWAMEDFGLQNFR